MRASVQVGDRVKFVDVFELAPDPVHDMLGEIGVAKRVTVVHKEATENTKYRCWNVWLVRFEDRQIWIKEKGLEVVDA